MQLKYSEFLKIPDWPRVFRVVDFITKHIKSGVIAHFWRASDHLRRKG